jgi:hypothetical protein
MPNVHCQRYMSGISQEILRAGPGGICRRSRQTLLSFALCRSVFLLLAVLFSSPDPARCAPTNAAPQVPNNRWLIIVDTSRPMESRNTSVQGVIATLVVSGMNGQMQPGDSLGMWTFNDELFAGQFPLQRWSPDTSKTIAMRILNYLHDQEYGKLSRVDKVMMALQRIAKDSEFLTVILISDGQNYIHGTPFDDKINASYLTWRKEQQKALMPFVTLLRARKGEFTEYTVTTPPWPLEIPALPADRKLVLPKPPPKPPVAPLIVSGKKVATNAASISMSRTTTVPPNSSTPPPTRIPVALVTTNTAGPAQTTSSNLTSLPSTEAIPVAAKTPPAEVKPPPPTVIPVEPPKSDPPETRPSPSAPEATSPPSPAPPPSPDASTQSNHSEPIATPVPAAEPTPADPVDLAVASPLPGLLANKFLWICGSVAAAAVFGILLVSRRRTSPPAQRISLITRSLDEER